MTPIYRKNFHTSLQEMGFVHSTKDKKKTSSATSLIATTLFVHLVPCYNLQALNNPRKLLLQNGYPQDIIS